MRQSPCGGFASSSNSRSPPAIGPVAIERPGAVADVEGREGRVPRIARFSDAPCDRLFAACATAAAPRQRTLARAGREDRRRSSGSSRTRDRRRPAIEVGSKRRRTRGFLGACARVTCSDVAPRPRGRKPFSLAPRQRLVSARFPRRLARPHSSDRDKALPETRQNRRMGRGPMRTVPGRVHGSGGNVRRAGKGTIEKRPLSARKSGRSKKNEARKPRVTQASSSRRCTCRKWHRACAEAVGCCSPGRCSHPAASTLGATFVCDCACMSAVSWELPSETSVTLPFPAFRFGLSLSRRPFGSSS
jgi:hypothetical protein